MIPFLERAEHSEIRLGVRAAEILQILGDSHGAAPAFAGSAEERVWETCKLVPAALAEKSAPSMVLQFYLQEPQDGRPPLLAKCRIGGGEFAFASKSQS